MCTHAIHNEVHPQRNSRPTSDEAKAPGQKKEPQFIKKKKKRSYCGCLFILFYFFESVSFGESVRKTSFFFASPFSPVFPLPSPPPDSCPPPLFPLLYGTSLTKKKYPPQKKKEKTRNLCVREKGRVTLFVQYVSSFQKKNLRSFFSGLDWRKKRYDACDYHPQFPREWVGDFKKLFLLFFFGGDTQTCTWGANRPLFPGRLISGTSTATCFF